MTKNAGSAILSIPEARARELFDGLLKDAGFDDITDLMEHGGECGLSLSSKTLYPVRNGKRNVAYNTLLALALRLSSERRIFNVIDILARLEFPVGRLGEDCSFTSKSYKYRRSIIDHFQKRFAELPYFPRQLERLRVCSGDFFPATNERERRDNPAIDETALESGRDYLVIGEGGIGKTTLLRKLALESALKGQVPIYIDMRKGYQEKGADYFAGKIRYQACVAGLDLTRDDLDAHTFVFLIDHLERAPGHVTKDISEFRERRHDQKLQDRFITGSRINVGLEGFVPVSIKRLEYDLVCEFLRKKGIDELHPQHDTRIRLVEFAQNPLRLDMLTKLLEEEKTGQEVQVTGELRIYEQYIRNRLKTDPPERKEISSSGVPMGWKQSAIAALAFEMTKTQNTSSFDRPDTEELLRDITEKIKGQNQEWTTKEILDDILLTGLISWSPKEGRALFDPDALQDFFVAWHLAKGLGKKQALSTIADVTANSEELLNGHWRKTLTFFAGLIKDATNLVRMLMSDGTEDIFYSNIELAYQCAAEAQQIDDPLRQELVDRIFSLSERNEPLLWENESTIREVLRLFPDQSDNRGQFLSARLGFCDPQMAARILEDFLSEPEWTIQKAAIYALKDARSGAALEVLTHKLEDGSAGNKMMEEIVRVLRFFRNRTSEKALIRQLENEDERVRYWAVNSLGRMKSKSAVPYLIKVLEDYYSAVLDLDRDERKRLKDYSAVLDLNRDKCKRLHRFDIEEVGKCTATALGNIGSQEAKSVLIEKLQELRANPLYSYSGLQYHVIQSLGKLRAEEAAELMTEALREPELAYAALEALGRIDSERTAEIIVNECVLGDAQVSCTPILGKMDPENTARPLMKTLRRLGRDDREHRLRVIYAIGCCPRTPAADLLVEILQNSEHDERDVQIATVRALRECVYEDGAAVDALISKLDDADRGMKLEAIDALGNIATTKAVEALAGLKDSKEKWIRLRVAEALWTSEEALWTSGLSDGINALVAMLDDGDEDVRNRALMSLTMMECEEIVNPLIEKMDDSSPENQLSIIQTLGSIGSPKATAPLLRKLKRKNEPSLISHIVSALGEIGSEESIGTLCELYRKYHSSLFNVEDIIINWPKFCERIIPATKGPLRNPLHTLWDLLPDDVRLLITNSAAGVDLQIEDKNRVVNALNGLLNREVSRSVLEECCPGVVVNSKEMKEGIREALQQISQKTRIRITGDMVKTNQNNEPPSMEAK